MQLLLGVCPLGMLVISILKSIVQWVQLVSNVSIQLSDLVPLLLVRLKCPLVVSSGCTNTCLRLITLSLKLHLESQVSFIFTITWQVGFSSSYFLLWCFLGMLSVFGFFKPLNVDSKTGCILTAALPVLCRSKIIFYFCFEAPFLLHMRSWSSLFHYSFT